MRVTNSMMISDMLWYANKNLEGMNRYQNQLSSGKRVEKPSDDPVAVTSILKYKTDISTAKQYQDNVGEALSWLQVSESSLDDVKEVLQRVRELSIQAANSATNTVEDTQKTASEIEQLKNELITLGNSTYAGKYIFSGFNTDKPLFNEDGTYNIDFTSQRVNEQKEIQLEVSVGEKMDVATYPLDIFGFVTNGSFFDGRISYGTQETTAATHSAWAGTLDMTHDFTTNTTMIFTIDGTTYTPDVSALDVTYNNPMTKERFLQVMNDAEDGSGNKLGENANLYYDENGDFKIESKSFGATSTVVVSNATGITNTSSSTGVVGNTATFSTTGPISDADVLAETGINTLTFNYDGIVKQVSVDFSSLNSVSDLVSNLNTQLNSIYPSGTFTVNGASGSNLDFTINPSNDGKVHSMDIDFTSVSQSQMIVDMENLITALKTGDEVTINATIDKVDNHLDSVLTQMGEIGGKTNRAEFIKSRQKDNEINYTDLLSKSQDVDYSKAIMMFKSLESIYRASLSVGSKVIQPSLVDFIR